MEEGAWAVWDLHCDQPAGSRQKTVDLLTSRAFEREARASESVPGPTTPDQKTKRTTLRKSKKTAPMAGHPCYPAMRPTPHRVVQAIVTYTLFTMEDKGIGWEGCKETKGCTPQKKVAMHQHTEMCFEALTNNARNMH